MTERNDARRPGHSARILVFAATEGYRHTSIPAAVAACRAASLTSAR